MKDTILFELVYDKDGNPDMQITMNTAKRGLRHYSLNNCRIQNFEDLPDVVQIETLYSLFLRIYKNYDEAEKEVITSGRKAENKRNFNREVMDQFVRIVEKHKQMKPGRFWKDAWYACAKYAKENLDKAEYEIVADMKVPAFTKMMTYYMEHPPL